jgi:hypothetical protein
MALDHYVSQVHLRNFYSPALGERLHAVRKSDGKAFTPNAESVCRIEEGSTNSYLSHDRAIEDFLKTVEPKYNAAVKRLAAGDIDPDSVTVIAGFAAYVMTCSPAAIRIQSSPMKTALENAARALDAAGVLPAPPAVLGGASLSDLLQRGKVEVDVDPKYPQAVGIANILKLTWMLGNSHWDILKNPFEDSPFFTSDFPAAIDESDDPHGLHRIVPLTPTLAIRIRPTIAVRRRQFDLPFDASRYRVYEIGREELLAINQLLVQCAEDLVFYRDDHPWVKPLISQYASYRIETQTEELAGPDGTLLVSRQRIVERR